MPCDINYKLFARSEHVNGVDFHPTKPWLLTSLDKGTVNVYSLESGVIINTLKIPKSPLRCAKFIARKDWLVAGSGDGQLHIFDYITNEEVIAFKAHSDSVNCLAVHPTAPLVLTGSADKAIKAWDWDKQWHNTQTYLGHPASVMSIAFNPHDFNNFASTSAEDGLVFWSISSPVPIPGALPNACGKNHVEFYPGSDKSYIITAAHDSFINIWDHLSNAHIKALRDHIYDVNFAVFHPNLPIIISGSYDGTVKIWNAKTYTVEHTFGYKLGWAMCVALRKNTNEVAVGFSTGVVTFELRHPGPKFSVGHPGDLIYACDRKALFADLQKLETITPISDGVQISLPTNDLGAIKILAPSILHSPNGRFVTLIGDGEFTIHATPGWHIESFGRGISFAWAPDSNTYAVLETQTQLKIYEDFKERGGGGSVGLKSFGKFLLEALSTGSRGSELVELERSGNLVMEGLYSGPLLGARGAGYLIFWDWDTRMVVRKIRVDVKSIYWSTTGTHVAITSSDTLYIFRFDRRAYEEKINEHEPPLCEGIPESFVLLCTLRDTIQTARWLGDLLIFTTPSRLCYSVAPTKAREFLEEEAPELDSYTISPTDKQLYLLEYIPAHERVYVMDKAMKVYAFGLSRAVVEFHEAVLRGDMADAKELLKKVPKERINELSGLLEDQIIKDLAMYKQCASLAIEVMEPGAAKKLISELRNEKAKDVAELLSKMVNDEDTFSQRDRKHTLHILSKLAKSAGVFPQSLVLEGVQCNHTTPIAWGGYGVIYKGTYKGSSICVKAVQADSRGIDEKKLRAHASELIFWAHLDHLNVLPFLGIYASQEEVPRICIVSPWMNNGDLLQYLTKVPEAPRKPLVCDIISGLQYLHDFDIIHADLKAKNILVSETGQGMLADFGISRLSMTQTTTSTNVAGSLYWMAPELLLDDEVPSRQSDMWAFACTCYEMITLTMPFSQQHSFPLLLRAFRKGDIIPLKPERPGVGWDEDVWLLAMRCWKSDPSNRPMAHELLDLMKSFNYQDTRTPDTKSQGGRSSVKIDYDRILSILEEVSQPSTI